MIADWRLKEVFYIFSLPLWQEETNLAAGHTDFYLSSTEQEAFHYLAGLCRLEKFLPNFESVELLFYLAREHKKGLSISLSWLLQTFLCRVSWSNSFWFQVCSHWLCSFFLFCNLCFSDTPNQLASVTSRALSPLFITFSVYSVPSIFLLPLIFSQPSVRRENWPHKKWKGLFKRNGSVMKTYYCIPWCTACGGCCWPTALLFS